MFENLYEELDRICPDIVVNTGDTAHTKTQISPEYVEMASNFVEGISHRCKQHHIILGNHDLNLMNLERQDALTPIIESLGLDNVYLHKKSGRAEFGEGKNFWVFSLADRENYPKPADWAPFKEDLNIGLFHGSVSNCLTDMNWRMTMVEHDLTIFDGLDFALLGDIHKQQFFRRKDIAYAGSLIQQNFGEEIDKGFLLWEIGDRGKDGKFEFEVRPVHLKGSRKFYTLRLKDDLTFPDTEVDEGSRVRIVPPISLTLAQQREIENQVKRTYKPHDVITLSSADIGVQRAQAGRSSVGIEDLRKLVTQEKLLREFFKGKNLNDRILTKVFELNQKLQAHVDQHDGVSRNVSWNLKKIAWSNFFNYGEGNYVDFERLPGLTGIFGANGSGKSNLVDVILETLFDRITKGVSKNIHLINDNRDLASAVAELSVNDHEYAVERNVERIKYGAKKYEVEKEWGKTSAGFTKVDPDGSTESLTGDTRPETERNIRALIGDFDDFLLTSLSAQWNPMDIISCKETKRREILYRFLDLDVFEQKCTLARDEGKAQVAKLSDLEDARLTERYSEATAEGDRRRTALVRRRQFLSRLETRISRMDAKILELTEQKTKVEGLRDFNWAHEFDLAEKKTAALWERWLEVQTACEQVVAELKEIGEFEATTNFDYLERCERRFKEIGEALSPISLDLRDLENELERLQKDAGTLGTVPCGDQYPGCRFLIDAFEAKRKIPHVKSMLQVKDDDFGALQSERNSLLKAVDQLRVYRLRVEGKVQKVSAAEKLRLQLENLRLKADGVEAERAKALDGMALWEKAEADILKNETLEKKIGFLSYLRKKSKGSLASLHADIADLSGKLGESESECLTLEKQLDTLRDLRETCAAYEYYIQAMGKDGIAYQILTQKLPLINEEINKVLSNAAEFGVSLEHDPENESISFNLQYGQYKSRPLELGGGAEKFLASMAIRVGLLNVSNLPKTNVFVVDEGFGKLDPRNMEAVQRMFDYLKTKFSSILVISHVELMKDLVDNIIEITADPEGYAHVEAGG